MFLETRSGRPRSAVKLYPCDIPAAHQRIGHLPIAPIEDLVRMKLTSFRLKDQVHIQDLDRAGLITPEIEASLPDTLRPRLTAVRLSE